MRDGYKWLVKSVIANYLDLGDRVQRDIAVERKAEEERRKEVRRRIEERRKREEEADGLGNGDLNHSAKEESDEAFNPPGFIPVDQLRSKWAEDEAKKAGNGDISHQNHDQGVSGLDPEPLSARRLTERLELEPISGPPKKRGLLSKLNKLAGAGGSEVRSLDSRISGDSEAGDKRTGAHTGYRNWGLAEELEPTAA